MNKTKRILVIILLMCIICGNYTTNFAKQVSQSEKINLVHDHDCLSVLKIIGKDMLKGVAYVCYKDKETGITYPAFCVEPTKEGVGTGAGDSYDVTLSELDSPILWRMLYYGYVGSNYKERGLECDDDLYYATKTAVHCFVDGTTPKEKYEVPTRVGYGENATLKEVQRRGEKVLEVAQEIYNYGYKGKDNYINAKLEIKEEKQNETTINGKKYLVQNYVVNTNKELSSYEVGIENFPKGTIILNSSNKEASKMTNNIFKIAISIENLTDNIKGRINVYNAQVKTYPIFYAASGSSSTQDYVIIDKSEVVNKSAEFNLNVYKSTLKINKKDDEGNAVPNVIFNLKYEDGSEIGNYKTNEKGEITVNKLKQGKIIITEQSAPVRIYSKFNTKRCHNRI